MSSKNKNVNRVLRDSEAVTRRMQQSKREIEVLRAEYEKLLERGVQGRTSNITDTDKQKEIQNKREEQDVQCAPPLDGDLIDNQRITVRRKPSDKASSADTARTALEHGSPPKVRHYNPEDAREYIRKQRERRLQQQKQLKETDNALELKKQKLKDLHQKSLQIIAKNRQRSKSREKKASEDVPESQILHEPPTAPKLEELKTEKPPALVIVTKKSAKPSVNIPSNANITYRENNAKIGAMEAVKYVKSSAKSDDAKIKAATLIQAYFRGHIQRKLYKDALQERLKIRQTQMALKTALKSRESRQIAQNILKKNSNRDRFDSPVYSVQEENDKDKKTEKVPPEWLQIEPTSHPFNFINSVKKKLNDALNTPVKATSDVGIQSSFCETLPQNENTPRCREMRQKIEQNLSVQKSDQEINAKIERSLEAIRNIKRGQQTSLSKRSKVNGVHLNDKGFVDLDAKILEGMKLQSDYSDSDTSKNIPEISMESMLYKTSSSLSQKSGECSESVVTTEFKQPREPPPKPKRMSRQDVYASAKGEISSSVAVETQKLAKDAQNALEHIGEYKLTIDPERLRNIKLQRSISARNSAGHLDNTMSQYEASKDRIKASEEQRSTLSSIRTISNGSQVKDVSSNSSSVESQKGRNTSGKSNPKKSINTDIIYSKYSGSRRDSIISGNSARYTRSFESYNTRTSSKDTKSSKIATLADNVKEHEITAEIPENLLSFRQYMKDMDDTQKITHTPFQPKVQGAKRGLDAEGRLREVISKVHLLDQSQSAERLKSSNNVLETAVEKVVLDNTRESFGGLVGNIGRDVKTMVEDTGVSFKADNLEQSHNSIVVKCKNDNEKKVSAKTSTETVAVAGHNQIHVKFEAELHLLNDFNESLKQIMNIEKSMLDLHTKYNLPPAVKETKDTQTSLATPQSITRRTSNTPTNNNNDTIASNTSIVQKSINFSRGSDFEEENHESDHIIVLHRNKNILESSRTNSNTTLNISNILLSNSPNSMESTQNALTLSGSSINTDLETKTPAEHVSNVGLSVGMFDQLIRDEDARIENLKAVLKIRQKTLLDRTKGELTWLEIHKKHLLETGKLHEASLVKKKQRGIILRLQEEKNEMQRLKEAQKAASKERKSKLKEQCAQIKAQLNKPQTPQVVTRIRRTSERRSSGPVKVYQSEYYQSETSVSRKSSGVEGFVYASRSESVISHVGEGDGAKDGANVAPSRTEMAKRSLQMREAALQKRRKEAEDLLRWHQRLVREERKIAQLEMAASNVINQVPAADGDKYIWDGVAAGCAGKSKGAAPGGDAGVSKYSTDFDSDGNDASADGSSQRSGSLNEIMQNINNITDEISELYKLSKSGTVGKDHGGSDSLLTESESKSHSSQASIVSRPKSVTVTVPEVSGDDKGDVRAAIVSGHSHHLETSLKTDRGSKTSPNASFIQIKLQDLSLHEVQLPEREETEDDVSSIKTEVKTPSGTDILVSNLSEDAIDACETLKEQLPSVSESKTTGDDNEQSKTHVEEVLTQNDKSGEVQDFLSDDIPPEIVETSEKVTEVQEAEEYVPENIEIVVETSIIIASDFMPSSKDISEVTEKQSAFDVVTDVVVLSIVDDVDKVDHVDNEVDDVLELSVLPSSKLDTSLEATDICIESIKDVSSVQEGESIFETRAIEEVPHKEVEEVEEESKVTLVTQTEIESDASEHTDVQGTGSSDLRVEDVAKNESVTEEDSDILLTNASELRSSEEVLPIIGIKIQEKKPVDADVGVREDSISVSDVSTIGEVLEEEDSSSKKSVDVKKRVSEILADANLNASIEEKSPRLPDIYVTTYDVISPDNSPELGSPVDNSKAKPKDIYGIGNEAQELLKKQLAIEQEIKQIERQQKEQIPYFVREIPNKPPPPYTPPVQQPTSIVPANAAHIEELAPQLAAIFHRGFVEKTLEYVTFPDTQLNRLENVDKICAEFLFDIAKDYAIGHYRQFVEPDEKTPCWMRLNKPKSFKRPHTRDSLEAMLKKKLKQLFAFEKSDCKESMIIKWSRKKRDHVDELLVVESQSEEAEWTNYDQDELIVREEVATGLLDMLIEETAACLQDIFAKRRVVS